MAKIRFAKSVPDYRDFNAERSRQTRRAYDEILGEPTSASPHGSTYWRRVQRCPREFGLWAGGLRKLDPFSDAILIGLLTHRALEFYYRALMQGRVAEAEAEAWASIDPFTQEPGYEKPAEAVERMLGRYFELYRDHDTREWRIIAVEETLEFEDPTLQWSGRFDAIIEEDGQLWGLEHKTTKQITEDLLSGYQMDLQIPGYSYLYKRIIDQEKMPGPFAGFIVNILTKDKLPKLERVKVVASRYHLEEFERSMKARKVMRDGYEALGYPKIFGNCVGAPRYFSRCDYFDVCHGRPEASVAQILSEDEPLHGFVNINRLTDRRVSTIDPDEAA